MSTDLWFETRGSPPQEVSLAIAAGTPVVQRREVVVSVNSSDWIFGARNVYQMKVWGDLDAEVDGRVRATEMLSEWMPYSPSIDAVLTVGAGTKTVSARLRTQESRQTDIVTSTITLGDDEPHAAILWRSRRRRTGRGAHATIIWSPSHSITGWKVIALPDEDADDGVLVSQGGAVSAGAPTRAEIPATAWDGLGHPQDGSMIARVQIQHDGRWY